MTIAALKTLKQIFSKPEQLRVLITAHMDPDFDAIGSALAFGHALAAQNIAYKIWLADKLGTEFNFLPGISQIVGEIPQDFNYNLVVTLDAAQFQRIRNHHLLNPSVPLLNIDHHHDNPKFGKTNIVWVISSVGEILFHLFKAWDWEITEAIATCLYAAIAFDTGHFRYSCTTPDTFRAAADLVERGANFTLISEKIFENKPLIYADLVKTALENVHRNETLGLVWTSLPQCPSSGGYDIIDFIRTLEGTNIVVVFREVDTQSVKISLRAKTDFDVSAFAHKFGGGGHKRAAGIRFNGSLNEAETTIITALENTLAG